MSGCRRVENWKPFEEKVLVEIMVNHTNNSIQNPTPKNLMGVAVGAAFVVVLTVCL
jgi:hypothetical protein